MPKIKDSHVIFLKILLSKGHKERQNLQSRFFKLKWLIYVEKLSPFFLFALYVSDNLVHFLLQLGTFRAQYTCTNHKNYEGFLVMLYIVYKETAARITASQC